MLLRLLDPDYCLRLAPAKSRSRAMVKERIACNLCEYFVVGDVILGHCCIASPVSSKPATAHIQLGIRI